MEASKQCCLVLSASSLVNNSITFAFFKLNSTLKSTLIQYLHFPNCRFLSLNSYSGLSEEADPHTTPILFYTKILILDEEVPFVPKHSPRSPQAQTNLHLLHNLQDAGNLKTKKQTQNQNRLINSCRCCSADYLGSSGRKISVQHKAELLMK